MPLQTRSAVKGSDGGLVAKVIISMLLPFACSLEDISFSFLLQSITFFWEKHKIIQE